MIEQIQNLDQFGFWVVRFRRSILEQQPVLSSSPQGLFQLAKLSGQAPYLFLLNNPWDSLPESLQRRLKIQYESTKAGNDHTGHLYIAHSGLRFKITSPMLVETPDGAIDTVGEYKVPVNGLELILAGEQRGWMIRKRPLGGDQDEKMVQYLIHGNKADRPLTTRRYLGTKTQELRDLVAFIEHSKDRVLICE